ncbi:SARP family transcriptional regulator [Lentzea sp. NBRC 105346]|uniref:ATP-binding protein n=1 Tax=Lentzea sp. NBRC 105346 TaxID=3032205 RepID=UPI0024A2A517|nr:NB-ARC domain-containing protein [Lentzea sp. NBRC 105346]GLZ29477.1 SARP family transcriptional regulator [Lentzea sp. NBRC 105346]
MLLDFHLLGPFEVRASHGRLNVGGASQQALLAALALDIGQTVPTERLAGVLWEGRPPTSYRQQLYKRVHALRAVLGAEAIVTEESGYRLDLAPVCSDLHRFSEQVAQARRIQSEGRFQEAAELFRTALSSWRRPALDGIISQLLRADAKRLDEKRALIARECQELERKPEEPEPAQAPAPRSAPAGLPRDMPSFTGRSVELAELDRELNSARDNPHALVITSITGTAGVGKTALAVHWAHRARHLFPDGQLYVNLRGFDQSAPMTAGEALIMFLRELGAPSERIPPDTDGQSLLYRSMLDGKRMLVVLDNAATMEQVEPLLPGSPGCVVLVTSRNALTGLVALHDASRVPLDSLTAEESAALLRRVLGEQRTSADPVAAARLAELCGHLPLALRIVAANLAGSRHTSIAEMVDRLSSADRLTQLRIDGVPRANVAAAFELSYLAVRPEAQRLLRLLSIVPGPDITADAASALGVPAADLLAELEAMHLVEQYRRGRFRLHDLVKLYVRNVGGPIDTSVVTGLLEFYVHSADAATAALSAVRRITPRPFHTVPGREFTTAPAALDWLSAEQDNVVAAAVWAHEHGEHVLCVHLVDALRGFFWLQRHTGDWLAVAEVGLAAARKLADPAAEALMHRSLGRACLSMERLDDALDHSLTAVRLWEQDLDAAAEMRLDVSLVYRANCRLDLAADQAGQALDHAREHGREDLEIAALNALFDCQMGLGRLDWTVATADRSLATPTTQRDLQLQAHAFAARGWAFHEMGRLDDARRDLAACVDLHDRCGNKESGELQRAYLGRVLLDAGDVDEAVRLLERARDELRELVPHWECVAVHGLALASFRRGQLDEALRQELDALEIARSKDFPPGCIEALIALSRIRLESGDTAAALSHAQEAIDMSEKHGWRLELGSAHHALAEACLTAGWADRARAHVTTALELHRASGQRPREAENLALLDRIPAGS